jgi:hypothetical protein
MADTDLFKLLAPDGSIIMTGSLSAVTEPILSSKAREATIQLLNDTAVAIENEEYLTRRRERAEAKARDDTIQRLCDGISRMAHRLDSLETERRERARQDRRRQRADIEASLPDPEGDFRGALPEPSLHGDLRGDYPDSATGILPKAAELPPQTGNLAVEEPEDLAHPQPSKPTPTAIGGP